MQLSLMVQNTCMVVHCASWTAYFWSEQTSRRSSPRSFAQEVVYHILQALFNIAEVSFN